jgi:hypothetical protein
MAVRFETGSSFSGYVRLLSADETVTTNRLHSSDQVVLGIAIGSFLGFGFRHLMRFCQRKELIDRQSYVAQYIALAMLTVGITTLLGSDDLLAAFTCGTAFAWDGFFNRQTEESVFSSVIDLLFNVAAFVYVGAWMPFSQFQGEFSGLTVWRLVVIAILVLLLRRLPIMIALYKWIPDVKTFREALFSGHFGPIGIGAPLTHPERSFSLTLTRLCLAFHKAPCSSRRLPPRNCLITIIPARRPIKPRC